MLALFVCRIVGLYRENMGYLDINSGLFGNLRGRSVWAGIRNKFFLKGTFLCSYFLGKQVV